MDRMMHYLEGFVVGVVFTIAVQLLVWACFKWLDEKYHSTYRLSDSVDPLSNMDKNPDA